MKDDVPGPPSMTLAATPSLAAPAGLDDSRLLPAGTRLDEFEIRRPLGGGLIAGDALAALGLGLVALGALVVS